MAGRRQKDLAQGRITEIKSLIAGFLIVLPPNPVAYKLYRLCTTISKPVRAHIAHIRIFIYELWKLLLIPQVLNINKI